MKDIPKIMVHHGTCDFCSKRHILVVHYNYHKQPEDDFCLCKKCYKQGGKKW